MHRPHSISQRHWHEHQSNHIIIPGNVNIEIEETKTIQDLIMSELIMCAKNERKHHQMEIDI